ncbi:transporter substrate-binding domain-containing protein [Georgenia ruanii]|uniref:transporter substrate-binding domain-containing protein n=1 Tax=Georgenia ruanii TaxID=348442 RepID=UPI00186B3B7E|nr:transporter substrate-binding domain-containing protein [Georgenia ruanii]
MSTRKLFVAGCLAGVLGLSACTSTTAGGGDKAGPGDAATGIEPVQELADALPDAIRDRGHLSFAATSANLPAQYVDEDGEILGAQVELIQAVGAVLDIPVEIDVVTNDAFDSGIASGRYDTVTRGDNADRQKTMDFIDTFNNGFSVIAHSGFELDELDYKTELCGVSTAVTKATFTENVLVGLSEECEARGEPAIAMNSYLDEAGVVLALQSEQNDVGFIEAVIGLAYVSKDPEGLKMVDRDLGEDVGGYFSGFAVKKGNTEFRDVLHTALLHLAELGVYQEIFEAYGIGELTLPEFPLNQGA